MTLTKMLSHGKTIRKNFNLNIYDTGLIQTILVNPVSKITKFLYDIIIYNI